MSSGEVSITKGRVAQTSKANAVRKLPAGLWSVVCSRGPYDKPAEGGTVSKSKVVDVIFYTTKQGIWFGIECIFHIKDVTSMVTFR